MFKIKKSVVGIILGATIGVTTIGGIATYAHTHAFSWTDWTCTGSKNAAVHQYVTGTHTDEYGHVTYDYGTCQMVEYLYSRCEKCGCGARRAEESKVSIVHMGAGCPQR